MPPEATFKSTQPKQYSKVLPIILLAFTFIIFTVLVSISSSDQIHSFEYKNLLNQGNYSDDYSENRNESSDFNTTELKPQKLIESEDLNVTISSFNSTNQPQNVYENTEEIEDFHQKPEQISILRIITKMWKIFITIGPKHRRHLMGEIRTSDGVNLGRCNTILNILFNSTARSSKFCFFSRK